MQIPADIQAQLKKRWDYPYKWFRRQNNIWDKNTNFIYTVPRWEDLIFEISRTFSEKNLDKQELFYYAINRWYNFWSARAVEEIFCQLPGIVAAKNNRDRLVDFTINNIPFDHKTSVFPVGFANSYAYAKKNTEELLYWLYKNQSTEQRNHFANRLFIVVYSENGEHWKLKAEIPLLETEISNYVATFDKSKLTRLQFNNGKSAVSDIIWVKK